jgi:hypothetical protein
VSSALSAQLGVCLLLCLQVGIRLPKVAYGIIPFLNPQSRTHVMHQKRNAPSVEIGTRGVSEVRRRVGLLSLRSMFVLAQAHIDRRR